MAEGLHLAHSSNSWNIVSSVHDGPSVISWNPKVVMPNSDRVPAPVVEDMTLRVWGTAHDNLATMMRSLASYAGSAQLYLSDRNRTDPVWLHAKMANETNWRRCHVRQIDAQFGMDWYQQPARTDNYLELAIAIERGPYWEGTAAMAEVTGSAISSVGGTFDYTAPSADITGDAPARLNSLALWSNGTIGTFWAGFRSVNRHAGAATYNPNVNIAPLITEFDFDAGTTIYTSAMSGTAGTVTFVSLSTWANRFTSTTMAAGYDGPMLVLARAFCKPAGTIDIRLWHGAVSAAPVFSDTVRVGNAAGVAEWHLHPLGVVDLTGTPTVGLWARRLSAAGTLYLDTLTFVPLDEYFVYASLAEPLTGFAGTSLAKAAQFWTRADDSLVARSDELGKFVANVSHIGAGIPVGDGRMVVCAIDEDDISIKTQTLNIALAASPRWSSLRGAE